MTGLPGCSVRAVPSVLLALLCSVLAAYPAAAAPAWESVSRARGVAVTATYHVDIAAVASRSDSPRAPSTARRRSKRVAGTRAALQRTEPSRPERCARIHGPRPSVRCPRYEHLLLGRRPSPVLASTRAARSRCGRLSSLSRRSAWYLACPGPWRDRRGMDEGPARDGDPHRDVRIPDRHD